MNSPSAIAAGSQERSFAGRAAATARLALAPRWRWLTLAALLACAACLRLSVWQFDRLAQATARQSEAAARAELPPLALDAPAVLADLLAGSDARMAELSMRRASARGSFDHEREEALTTQVLDGRLGVRLLSPLRVTGTGGAVLVDRGWLPVDYDRPIRWVPFRTTGPVSVEGRLRTGFRRTTGGEAPAGDGLVPDLDLDRMASTLPYPLVRIVLVQAPDATKAPAADLPVRRDLQASASATPHLAYALQWLAFAVIVGGGYASLVASDPGRAPRIARVRTTPATG